MSVKPELAFDVCWEVYRGAREVLETKRGISALNWKDTGKFLWRPDFRPRLNEWVADFALAGKAALDGPDWASRMVLFRLYYLGLAPYENARHFLGLSEHSWVNWTEEIRHRCGKELLGRSMFRRGSIFNRYACFRMRGLRGRLKERPLHDHVAGLHGAVNRFAVGIAASLVQKQALLQDRAGKLFHHPRLLEHTALEPALELPGRSDSTIGKGHERGPAKSAASRS